MREYARAKCAALLGATSIPKKKLLRFVRSVRKLAVYVKLKFLPY